MILRTGCAADGGDSFPRLDRVADLPQGAELSAQGEVHHALDRIAADVAGNAGVGDSAARPDHAAERVAAHRLHNGVAVRPGGEARPTPTTPGASVMAVPRFSLARIASTITSG